MNNWAHAAAHGADVMDELVQCRECNVDIIKEILNAFKKILHNGKYIFHTEEDERICRVVFRIKTMHYDSTLGLINVIFNEEEKLNRFLKTDRELVENQL